MASDRPDDVLAAYQRELLYLRNAGAEFAMRYPKIAARLELGPDACADPHVERLLEGFAFLTGRLQNQIDAEFPRFTTALLDVLYPHLLQPAPPVSVAQLQPDLDQGLPLSGFEVPTKTRLFAQSDGGDLCRFRTTYPVTLWPLRVTEAALEPAERYPFLDRYPQVLAVARVRIEAQRTHFAQLTLKHLRFFLSGEARTTFGLYDLLVGGALGVCVIPDRLPKGAIPTVQLGEHLRPVGLEPAEAVLPAPPHAHPAYRLLQEYLLCPEKFLFFDVELPGAQAADKSLDLLILLKETPRGLAVSADTFALGCTPIVNLFTRTTEPIRLTQRQSEYRLVADQRDERSSEIHSVLRVSASADPSHPDVLEPFFSFSHPADGTGHQAFYCTRRAPTGRADLPGTDLWLSFVDLRFRPTQPALQTVYAHALCTSRDLATQIGAGARLQLDDAAPVKQVVALRKPTDPVEPPIGGRGLWQLISHLSLNHLSLGGEEECLRALREILRLYRFSPSSTVENQILGIQQMQVKPAVRHIGEDAWRGFCQGLEVTLTVDESQFIGGSALLLSSVLSRFFGLYAAVNSFVQLAIRSQQRQGVWKRWPPIAGRQRLL